MEPKQLITQTIEVLANYTEQQQVDVFLELKNSLLRLRKDRQEALARQIEELQCLDKHIFTGNMEINGDNSLKMVAIEPAGNSINRGY